MVYFRPPGDRILMYPGTKSLHAFIAGTLFQYLSEILWECNPEYRY